jgi:hypothetical protein
MNRTSAINPSSRFHFELVTKISGQRDFADKGCERCQHCMLLRHAFRGANTACQPVEMRGTSEKVEKE